MIRALRALFNIKRDQAHWAEIPIVRVWASWLNSYKQEGAPLLTEDDLCKFGKPKAARINPDVAAVIMELHHQQKAPSLLLTVWQDVVAAAQDGHRAPEVRALHSDDLDVWIVAPRWEGAACRAGLVAVGNERSGEVLVRDLDRPLLTYRLVLPQQNGCGWVATGELLAAAT